MAANAYTALGNPPPSWPAARDVIVAQSGLTFSAASAVPGTDCAPALEIRVAGVTYFYDAADTTSAHDGSAVMVSGDGRRYKLGFPQFVPNQVETYGNTPPGSPVLGKSYLVGVAPSGAWSAHANKIATWTVNGWVFIAPANMAGRMLYVASEDATYQYTASGWRKGLGASALSEDTVLPEHLYRGLGKVWLIENQTTNTPGSGTFGLSYIVGPSPTGAWAGQQFKIATWFDAWTFYTPRNGDLAYDRNVDRYFVYEGGAWLDLVTRSQSVTAIVAANSPNAQNFSVVGGGNSITFKYTYLDGTAPTTTQRRLLFNTLAVTMGSSASGRKLVFEWDGLALTGVTDITAVGIFRDSEASALLWVPANFARRLIITSDDANVHTYTLAVMVGEAIGTVGALAKNFNFSLMEIA